MSLPRREVPLRAPLCRAIFGALALLLILATAAHAGRYHAYSCRTPSGAAAPADGWSASTTGTFTYAGDTCAAGGALVAGVEAEIERAPNTALATWAFSAPPGATLAAATLWRAGDAVGATVGGTYQFWFAGPTEPGIFDECIAVLGCTGQGNNTQPLASENRLAVPAANLGSHLYMNASCTGVSGYKCPLNTGDAHGYAAVAYLYAADLLLEQPEGPSSGGPTGRSPPNSPSAARAP